MLSKLLSKAAKEAIAHKSVTHSGLGKGKAGDLTVLEQNPHKNSWYANAHKSGNWKIVWAFTKSMRYFALGMSKNGLGWRFGLTEEGLSHLLGEAKDEVKRVIVSLKVEPAKIDDAVVAYRHNGKTVYFEVNGRRFWDVDTVISVAKQLNLDMTA